MTAATPPRPDEGTSDSLAEPPRVSHRDRRSWWLWGGGIVLSAGILTGLFWLGTMTAPAPAAPSPSVTPDSQVLASPSPSPVAPEPSGGPVAPGDHRWDQLRGGECLQPFETPWAETLTVVGCDQPHAAEMVYTDAFEGGPGAPYPGTDALAEQIPLLCGTPDVIDFSAAEHYTDIEVEGTYPLTQEEWDAGRRNWYCFVNRAGGEPIEGSLAVH